MKKFGDKIIVTKVLVKLKTKYITSWVEFKPPVPYEGIVIGVRVLKEGETEIEEDWYEGKKIYHRFFIPSKHIKCYLVAFNLRSKPIYVPIEDEKEMG